MELFEAIQMIQSDASQIRGGEVAASPAVAPVAVGKKTKREGEIVEKSNNQNMENNNDKLSETFSIDNFNNYHTQDEVLDSYFDQLNALSEYAVHNYAIEPNDFYEMLIDELQPVLIRNELSTLPQRCRHYSLNKCPSQTQSPPTNTIKSAYKELQRYIVYVGIVCILIVLVNYHANISRMFMRNIQTFIYPGMRYWRKLTLPMIREFPQLTNLYDESCLLSNPFFYVTELDCTPCVNVINVVDLSGYLGHFDNSMPHIIKQVWQRRV